jgi:hypothetical protein
MSLFINWQLIPRNAEIQSSVPERTAARRLQIILSVTKAQINSTAWRFVMFWTFCVKYFWLVYLYAHQMSGEAWNSWLAKNFMILCLTHKSISMHTALSEKHALDLPVFNALSQMSSALCFLLVLRFCSSHTDAIVHKLQVPLISEPSFSDLSVINFVALIFFLHFIRLVQSQSFVVMWYTFYVNDIINRIHDRVKKTAPYHLLLH